MNSPSPQERRVDKGNPRDQSSVTGLILVGNVAGKVAVLIDDLADVHTSLKHPNNRPPELWSLPLKFCENLALQKFTPSSPTASSRILRAI